MLLDASAITKKHDLTLMPDQILIETLVNIIQSFIAGMLQAICIVVDAALTGQLPED